MDYLGKDIPKLGFGLMRLPMMDGKVDIEQVKTMVDLFLDAGFTYFDTAYGYLNGMSEQAVKTALVDRYAREKFQLATKLPAWLGAKNPQEAKQMFYTSLERTGAGYFDYYLLHNCGDSRIQTFDEFGIWDFVLEQREKGLIKHAGFSFHDKAEVLEQLLTKHPQMEFVQLQINYADWENELVQARKCYEVARQFNKPIIIMEPVKGGLLANPPQPVADILQAANSEVSFSSWALRFAASLDQVITVLSGMSDIAQMEDNLKTMRDFKPLDETEQAVVENARTTLAALPGISCTGCQYCVKGCPAGVAIPNIFGAMNSHLIYDNLPAAKGTYNGFIRRVLKGLGSQCIECGQCEAVCPQHLPIVAEIKRAVALLEE